jgi:hypothetical protein
MIKITQNNLFIIILTSSKSGLKLWILKKCWLCFHSQIYQAIFQNQRYYNLIFYCFIWFLEWISFLPLALFLLKFPDLQLLSSPNAIKVEQIISQSSSLNLIRCHKHGPLLLMGNLKRLKRLTNHRPIKNKPRSIWVEASRLCFEGHTYI